MINRPPYYFLTHLAGFFIGSPGVASQIGLFSIGFHLEKWDPRKANQEVWFEGGTGFQRVWYWLSVG